MRKSTIILSILLLASTAFALDYLAMNVGNSRTYQGNTVKLVNYNGYYNRATVKVGNSQKYINNGGSAKFTVPGKSITIWFSTTKPRSVTTNKKYVLSATWANTKIAIPTNIGGSTRMSSKSISMRKVGKYGFKSKEIEKKDGKKVKLLVKKKGKNEVRVKIKKGWSSLGNSKALKKGRTVTIGAYRVKYKSGSERYPKFVVTWNPTAARFAPGEDTIDVLGAGDDLVNYGIITLENIWDALSSGNVEDPRELN